jgi:hypothetical protein
MLDKVLFWVVLVWMVREVWRDSNLPPEDEGEPGSKPGDSNASGGGKVGGA